MCSPEAGHCFVGNSAARMARGAVLIELMVGLTVGALVTATALTLLQPTGQTQRIVDDQSQLLQQASFVFRVLGQQIRAAGALEIESIGAPDPMTGLSNFRYASPANAPAGTSFAVRGTSSPPHDALTVIESPFIGAEGGRRDCLGQEVQVGKVLSATFHVDDRGVMRCKSSSGQNQPIAFGVAAFHLRYRLREGERSLDLDAAAVEKAGSWSRVNAVEVCLDLRGAPIQTATEHTYQDCADQDAVDQARRHLVMRRLFQLRTAGDV